MVSSFLRSLPRLVGLWKPLNFCNPNFVRIPPTHLVEEETTPDYVASRYYPTRIGQVLQNRYQVVGKLGFGVTSTVWLARDLTGYRHVTLKIFVNSAAMGQQLDDEYNMYRRLERGSNKHPGRVSVRSLLDSFDLNGPEGPHRCLVHPPLWDSVDTFLRRNPVMRLPVNILAIVLRHLFLALDFLHTECQVIHTDIKADNIMLGIADDSVFRDFEQQELQDPSARKELEDGRTIYVSRELRMPNDFAPPVLCDFGSAVAGDVEHSEDIQPNFYRAPEVILEAPWTYSVDVWNVGCMVWGNFEGEQLFTGEDPELQTYRSRAHLAEIVALLGPPPPGLLARGAASSRFFSDKGDFNAEIALPEPRPLEDRETTLEEDAEDRELFLRLMCKMIQWDPARRSSPRELADDAWIRKHTS